MMAHTRLRGALAIPRKSKAGGVTFPDCRAALKTAWCWHKTRHVDQCGQLVFHRKARTPNGKRTVSSVSGAGNMYTALYVYLLSNRKHHSRGFCVRPHLEKPQFPLS